MTIVDNMRRNRLERLRKRPAPRRRGRVAVVAALAAVATVGMLSNVLATRSLDLGGSQASRRLRDALVVYETETFGRVLHIDGDLQLTE